MGVILVSHTEGKKHVLSILEHRVLRNLFGSKSDEVTVDWRKLHSEELHNL